MQAKCENCIVPEIIARMNTTRERLQAARENARLSETPTQAQPYQEEAVTAGVEFENARKEFATEYPKQCFTCTYPN